MTTPLFNILTDIFQVSGLFSSVLTDCTVLFLQIKIPLTLFIFEFLVNPILHMGCYKPEKKIYFELDYKSNFITNDKKFPDS